VSNLWIRHAEVRIMKKVKEYNTSEKHQVGWNITKISKRKCEKLEGKTDLQHGLWKRQTIGRMINKRIAEAKKSGR